MTIFFFYPGVLFEIWLLGILSTWTHIKKEEEEEEDW